MKEDPCLLQTHHTQFKNLILDPSLLYASEEISINEQKLKVSIYHSRNNSPEKPKWKIDVDTSGPVEKPNTTSFFQYIYENFLRHQPIVITPDYLWFELLAMLSQNTIKNMDFYNELWNAPMGNKIIECERKRRLDHSLLKEKSQVFFPFELDLLMPKFTTSEELSLEAFLSCTGDIALSQQIISGGCGIPLVRLEGTRADWLQFSERIPLLMLYFELCIPHLRNVLKIVDFIRENFDNDQALSEFFKKMLYSSLAMSDYPDSGAILKGWLGAFYNLDHYEESQQAGVEAIFFPCLTSVIKWCDRNLPNKAFLRTYALASYDSLYAHGTTIKKPRFMKIDLETSDTGTVALFRMGKFNRDIHEGLGRYINTLV